MRDKEPLTSYPAVLYFGYMVGGSGLLMLLSLVAALISRDGKFLGVMFFLGMTMFFLGYYGADVAEFFAPQNERNAPDRSANQTRELDESDPWKYTRKRKRARKTESQSDSP